MWIDHAVEICEWLSKRGEICIVTNGIHSVQTERIKNSGIALYISFVSVSEECGYAKPDVRFCEYSLKMAAKFSLHCPPELVPKHNIRHLSEIRTW